uniref:Uncharacterized protein n=1 Tax=Glossina pallidipes TaxID=7398 RepID=A0A1A9ZLD7_GLOPL
MCASHIFFATYRFHIYTTRGVAMRCEKDGESNLSVKDEKRPNCSLQETWIKRTLLPTVAIGCIKLLAVSAMGSRISRTDDSRLKQKINGGCKKPLKSTVNNGFTK